MTRHGDGGEVESGQVRAGTPPPPESCVRSVTEMVCLAYQLALALEELEELLAPPF